MKRTGRAVALKVHADKAGYRELKILQRICEKCPQPEHLIELLDHFELEGPNGRHLCLVIELMWSDLANFMGGQCNLPDIRIAVTREATKQVLKALETLGKLGVIHNGYHS